jgi:hypothetical protein
VLDELDRFGQPRDQVVGQLPQVDLALVAGDHGELVAAQPGRQRPIVHQRSDPPCDLDQHLVARAVTECVVHGLEPVEIEVDDPDGLGRGVQALFEVVVEAGPVHQTRERVVRGGVGGRFVATNPLDHQTGDPGETGHGLAPRLVGIEMLLEAPRDGDGLRRTVVATFGRPHPEGSEPGGPGRLPQCRARQKSSTSSSSESERAALKSVKAASYNFSDW